MKRRFAYICSPFRGNERQNIEKAREYCRMVFDAGYTPIAPHLLFPQFLDDDVPVERDAGMSMANDLLRRCSIFIICGTIITEGMTQEIVLANRLNIPSATLEGVLTARAKGGKNRRGRDAGTQ